MFLVFLLCTPRAPRGQSPLLQRTLQELALGLKLYILLNVRAAFLRIDYLTSQLLGEPSPALSAPVTGSLYTHRLSTVSARAQPGPEGCVCSEQHRCWRGAGPGLPVGSCSGLRLPLDTLASPFSVH